MPHAQQGSLFRNSEGLDTSATGLFTTTQQNQASAVTEGFSTTLFQKYNAMRALDQSSDAQANAWDLTANKMTHGQMMDSMRQAREFRASQNKEASERTLMWLGVIAVGAVILYGRAQKSNESPVAGMSSA